jgi:hypothetical protein
MGAFVRPNWQVAVESAQVLSGIVSYPLHNSFHIYHVKLWTLVNQLAAVPLALGFGERALSVFVSGGVTALSFAAVGLCVFAVSRNAFWGIAAPFLITFSGVPEALAVNYPMDFMGTPHTYGVVALAWSLATLSLIALERYVAGGIFLGLAPAMHPSMGLWSWAIVLAVLVWNGRDSTRIVPKIWRPAAAGLGVSVMSFFIQWMWMRPVLPYVEPSVQAGYVSTWVSFFDFHRRAVDFGLPGVELTMAAALIGLYLIPFLNEEDVAPLFLLRTIIVTSFVALLGAGVSRLPASLVPQTLLTLMPTRLFLLSNLAFAATLVGLLIRFKGLWPRITALLLVAGLASANPRYGVYSLIVCGIAVAIWKSVFLADGQARLRMGARVATIAAGAAAFAIVVSGIWGYVRTSAAYRSAMVDRTNNAPLTAASNTPGLLVTATQCCPFTQMRTRRPLLVETMALDQIMYAPESAPDMNAALKVVYGVDLLHPAEILRSPGFEEDLTPVTKPLWEMRSSEEWKRLGAEFGFAAILTGPNWKLQLPEAARDPGYVLYRIP